MELQVENERQCSGSSSSGTMFAEREVIFRFGIAKRDFQCPVRHLREKGLTNALRLYGMSLVWRGLCISISEFTWEMSALEARNRLLSLFQQNWSHRHQNVPNFRKSLSSGTAGQQLLSSTYTILSWHPRVHGCMPSSIQTYNMEISKKYVEWNFPRVIITRHILHLSLIKSPGSDL